MRFNYRQRFDNLPQGRFTNRLLFVLYRRLYSRLLRAKMLDINWMWYPKHQLLGEETASRRFIGDRDLICVTGFSYSGSGAVLDILAKYDDVTLVHAVDMDCGRKLDNTISAEFDLLRHSGGVFELEEAFHTENAFLLDGVLKAS